jgi:hypothetical protein
MRQKGIAIQQGWVSTHELFEIRSPGLPSMRRSDKPHPGERDGVVVLVGLPVVRRESPNTFRHPPACLTLAEALQINPSQPDVVAMMEPFIPQIASLERAQELLV